MDTQGAFLVAGWYTLLCPDTDGIVGTRTVVVGRFLTQTKADEAADEACLDNGDGGGISFCGYCHPAKQAELLETL